MVITTLAERPILSNMYFGKKRKKQKIVKLFSSAGKEGVRSVCLLIKNKIHILTEVYVCSIFSNVLNGGLGVRLPDKSYPNQLPWEGACMCMHISVPLHEQYFKCSNGDCAHINF